MEKITMDESRSIQLNILKEIHRICEENGLRYYLAYGTLLGAVRHGGFIPWDDDIDIVMPRSDYMKFFEIAKSDICDFYSVENNSDYIYLFAKASDKGTVINNDIERCKVELGVSVDIFPVDGAGDSFEEGKQSFSKLTVLFGLYAASTWKKYVPGRSSSKKKQLLRFISFILSRFVSRKYMMKKYNRMIPAKNFDECAYSAVYVSLYREKEVMPFEVYGEPSKISFEGEFFNAPNNCHAYLTSIYGDYMKLPPVEQRVPLHTTDIRRKARFITCGGFQMPSFEVLCATMHQNDFSKVKEMNIKSDVVFANQCDHTSYEEMAFDGHTAKMISTQTRGVGKNRNLALIYASADICLFADDDVVYNDDYEKTICNFYEEHPDADVVVFNFLVSRNGSTPKNIISTTKKLAGKKLSYGTYAISVRRSVVDWHNIKFHHQFGGGTPHACGEDTCFLNDCFNNGLTVYVCSETIGAVDHKDSTWFDGYTDKYFIDRGILFYSLMGKLAVPATVYHCIKHRDIYSEFGWKKALKLMIEGSKKAKKMD